MRTVLAYTTLVFAASLLMITLHFHDEAHGYDVVGFAAGSGGAQDQPGQTEIKAYLVDHKTGRVWRVGEVAGPELVIPTRRLTCTEASKNYVESETGCVFQNSAEPNRK